MFKLQHANQVFSYIPIHKDIADGKEIKYDDIKNHYDSDFDVELYESLDKLIYDRDNMVRAKLFNKEI